MGCWATGLLGYWAVGLSGLFDCWVLLVLLGARLAVGLSCVWVVGPLGCWAVVAFCCLAVGLLGWAGGLEGCSTVGFYFCCWDSGL